MKLYETALTLKQHGYGYEQQVVYPRLFSLSPVSSEWTDSSEVMLFLSISGSIRRSVHQSDEVFSSVYETYHETPRHQ